MSATSAFDVYAALMASPRPVLATIDQRIESGTVSVRVTLGVDGGLFTGSADGPEDTHHRARLVGEATLRAVELAVGGSASFDLTAVATQDLGPLKVALAQVRDIAWKDYLVGSALVREGDPATATARAVLDALNRRISTTHNGSR